MGKTKGLAKRHKAKKVAALTPTTDSETQCDAILLTRAEFGTEKDALQQELDEELDNEYAGEQLVVGNRRGLNLAVRSEEHDRTMAAMVKKIAIQDTTIATLKREKTFLEAQVRDLTASLVAYKTLRNRFISTYKRDVLNNATEDDRRIITAGNSWAHGGDAVVDASLYRLKGPGARSDDPAYVALYGVSPTIVLESLSEREMGFYISQKFRLTYLDDPRTIKVLNSHAGVVASKYKHGSETFYANFRVFVSELKKGENYDAEAALNNAYWTFMNCTKAEVEDVVA